MPWAVLILLLGFAAPLGAQNTQPPPIVFVSVPPQAYFAKRIGADSVQLEVLVEPGHSPATYEPSPAQMTRLAQASLYFRIGVPFEKIWLPRIQQLNPAMHLLDNRAAIPLAGGERPKEEEHDHRHEGEDPHIWTSPVFAIKIAEQILEGLTRLNPQHEAIYRRNYQTLKKDLEALHQDTASRLAPFKGRTFLVFHPAWGHFAKTYGLRQLAVEHEGKESGAKMLAQLITQAQQENIRVLLTQKQFSRHNARQVAQAIKGNVIALDPLDQDYLNNMRHVARIFADNL